jgi:hypothetical protein
MQMKKLVFAALLCGGIAQMGTGCVITSGDDDPNVVYDGTISASWFLVAGDANSPTGCPEGATTMEVITEDAGGFQIVDKFYCADGSGIIEREPGTYDIWTRLTDDTSTFDYAMSTSVQVSVEQGVDTPADFTFSIDRGSFYFGWEIAYAGEASDCNDPAIGDLAVTTTLVGTDILYDDPATCDNYNFTVPGLPLGDYVVSVSLLDPANELAVYVADPVEASIDYGNHFNDLGIYILDAAGN